MTIYIKLYTGVYRRVGYREFSIDVDNPIKLSMLLSKVEKLAKALDSLDRDGIPYIILVDGRYTLLDEDPIIMDGSKIKIFTPISGGDILNREVDPLELVRDAYRRYRDDIHRRLKEFNSLGGCGDERLFLELIFCILTPQSRAIYAWNTVKEIYLNGCLWRCNYKELSNYLVKSRFRFNKARYIIEARERFLDGSIDFKELLDGYPIEVRHRLASIIKGIGYKEASHFLRNIGYTFDIAILDRHILKYMQKFRLINEIPRSLTPKKYLLLEDRFIWLSRYLGIKPAELDLLLWALETGYIFR